MIKKNHFIIQWVKDWKRTHHYLQVKISVSSSKMVWSSKSHRSSTAVLVFERQMKPERRVGIAAMVKEKVQRMHVCLKRPSGWDVCECSEGCFENTERQKRSTTTCTIICTWRPRVMCSKTRESWWNTSTGRRPRSNVPNSLGEFFFVFVFDHVLWWDKLWYPVNSLTDQLADANSPTHKIE